MTVVVPITNAPAYADEPFELPDRKRPRPRKKTLDTLAKARHHLRRNLPLIPCNRTGRGQDNGEYGWADLEQVDAIIWPYLDAYGLSWETAPDTNPATGKMCLRWRITHLESGETESGYMSIRDGHPQDQGAAFTYAQRYALVIVSGAVVEKGDDDCARPAAKPAAAKAEQPRTPATPRVTQQRVDEWTRSILALSTPTAADRAHGALRAQRIESERVELAADVRNRYGLPLAGPVTLEDLVQAVRETLEVEEELRGNAPVWLAPVDDLPEEPADEEDDGELAPLDSDPLNHRALPQAAPETDPFDTISAGIPDHPDHDPDTSPTPSG